ncbi:MAG TPA: hypothetical protein VD969_03750 [Symbiobacteriaceae bacterium]|nr:hypothetical protein [Symbiobacteriaceae bacterium]
MRRPDDIEMDYHGLDAVPIGEKKPQPAKYDADFSMETSADYSADFSVDLGSDPRDRSLAERVNRQ